MKQTVEEAAKEELIHSYSNKYNGNGTFEYGQKAMLNMFYKGAEWHAKQSPWISVKDKLPDNQNIVLVRDEYDGFCPAYLHGPKSGFITYGEEAYRKFGEITHWMPIPPLESNDNE